MMTRRGFVKAAGCAGVAALLGGEAQGQARPDWHVAVGLNGFESGERKYRKSYPIWEILDFASREKFDGVELVQGWPRGNYPASNEKERVAALRGLYDRYGLRIFSIQTGADGAFDPDEEGRRKWLEQFRDRIALGKALGCANVGLWPYGALRGQELPAALDRLVASFIEARKIAEGEGIIPAFEIEPVFAFNKAEHALAIQRGSGMKMIYDPSHFDLLNGATGRPEELLEKVGVKNIGYLQLSDCDGTLRDGGTSKHMGVGEGHCDIAKSLRILREGGFAGWIMMDTWEVPDPYDACRRGKQAVREAMA